MIENDRKGKLLTDNLEPPDPLVLNNFAGPLIGATIGFILALLSFIREIVVQKILYQK